MNTTTDRHRFDDFELSFGACRCDEGFCPLCTAIRNDDTSTLNAASTTTANNAPTTKEVGEDLVESGSSPPPGPAPTGPRKRRPKSRCTCSLYGTCTTCQEIAERRLAAELRNRFASDE